MGAFRTLWAALVGLYEETLVLIAGNVSAVALNLPIGLVLVLLSVLAAVAAGVPLLPGDEGGGTPWPLAIVAWLMVFLPTPGNVALGGLAQGAAGRDAPRFVLFRRALRAQWRLALRCTLVSTIVTAALLANLYFYVAISNGWLRFVAIIWLYGLVLWLSMHVYLVPLQLHVAETRVLHLYRRAALVVLGHPWYTLVLLLGLLAVSLLSVVFLPVYVLVGPAYISAVQAHALREIRRRHGDLVEDEAVEEANRL